MKAIKTFTQKIMPLLFTVVVLAACSKGERGETGPQGEQGAKGSTGVKGADGNTVLNGTTAPAATLGSEGDFYLNTANSTLYGPKTAAGWGNGSSLKGATGNTGAAGSKMLSGNGAPAADLGANGDFYFDKTGSSMYGPKVATGWGLGTSLKGATGATGATGTANVMYSGWQYAVNFNDTTVDNSNLKVGHLIAPSLTTELLNSANMQVFFTYGGGVLPLPYTSFAGGKSNTISYQPKFKQFIITRFTADNSNSVMLSTLLQYRYVIIPGGKALATAKKINMNNYEEVKRTYNIPD